MQVLYTVGPMVETLIRCKADSYLVFRLMRRSTHTRSYPTSPVSPPMVMGDKVP